MYMELTIENSGVDIKKNNYGWLWQQPPPPEFMLRTGAKWTNYAIWTIRNKAYICAQL